MSQQLKPIGPYVVGQIVSYEPRAQAAAAAVAGGARWHVVQCQRRTDGQAIEWLKRSKFEIYYPTQQELRRVPNKRLSKAQRTSGLQITRAVAVPMFPRYLFVRLAIEVDGWQPLFERAGVVGLVSAGRRVVYIPDGKIAEFRSREVMGSIPGSMLTRVVFGLGEEVRVVDGPFAQFNAVVEKALDLPLERLDAATRIKVAVNVFGRATPVELCVDQVAKL